MEQENGLLGAVAAAGGTIGRAIGEAFAAEKRLNETMAAGPGGGQQFNVTKETVLQAGKIIGDQADALARKWERSRRDLKVVLDGSDPVNVGVADAWNSRLVEDEDSYAERIREYITSLDNLAEQLRQTAEQYGFTEEEVIAAFGAKSA
ncbi:hypothetical protein ALI22I_40095 [Saccharothrix sp. ALI-22-I]|uniref:hypothetical protein n=1 Tax=Saccharothrix sp. ALI-22-I TaxID=1933778 RepID=UPI00097BC92B|nr:hypothetical protein [Saccharothrix sp. ALI-22-I]ONI82318.1 hypothetical protein ALI22I_40095 [Saccharothrix sp. ALI-22-I]